MKNPSAYIIQGLFFSTLAVLASCASRPDSIAPSNVSSLEYQNLSCTDTTSLLSEKRSALQAAESQQNSAATGDALGVFFLLIPVSSVFGGDNEGAVAQYKGEVIALERALGANCQG